MMTCNVSNSLRNQYKWNLANRHYTQGAGAVGLGILNDIPHDFIGVNVPIPVSAARLYSPFNITVISIYVPPNSPEQDIMDSLEYITSKLEPPFIIGGDFNAAHEAWGSPKSDKRGLSLLSWVVENILL